MTQPLSNKKPPKIVFFKIRSSRLRFLFAVFNINQNIVYLAIQNFTESVQRFCADWFAVLHPMQNIRGKPLLIDKIIFCYTFTK